MLGAILGPYGDSSSDADVRSMLPGAVRAELAGLEDRIVASVTSALEGQGADPDVLSGQLENLRGEIAALTAHAASTAASSAILPEHLRDSFLEWRAYPGHFNIMWAVLSEDLTSAEEVAKVARTYGTPTPPDAGVRHLIEENVLAGDPAFFEIPAAIRPALAAWIDRNLVTLERLREMYEEAVRNGITVEYPGSDDFRQMMFQLRRVARTLDI